jgi:hypothetical protein
MSISVEILPQKRLNENWKDELLENLDNPKLKIIEIGNNDYYRLLFDELGMFDFWKVSKESSAEFFADVDYISHMKNIDTINVENFLNRFKKVEYSILFESKPLRKEEELSYMFASIKHLAAFCDGLIIFDQNFAGFLSDTIYRDDDIKFDGAKQF